MVNYFFLRQIDIVATINKCHFKNFFEISIFKILKSKDSLYELKMHVLPEIAIDICEIFGTFVIFKEFLYYMVSHF